MTAMPKKRPTPPARPVLHPDPIDGHPDHCPCPRCIGLERCPACERIKLDFDWCWKCRRLVM